MNKQIAAAAAAVVLAGAAAAAGYAMYRGSHVSIADVAYTKDAPSVSLTQDPTAELEQLRQFTALKQLDVRGSGITAVEYEALQEALPDTEILWEVPFQGRYYSPDIKELTISDLSQEDLDTLDYFPKLSRVDAGTCRNYEMLEQLQQKYPDCSISYTVDLGGKTYGMDETRLAPEKVTVQELTDAITLLPRLKTVDLRNSGLSGSECAQLASQFPDIHFLWNFLFAGETFSTDVGEIEISGIEITDTSALEEALPSCKNLKKLVLLDSGLSNEALDALNKRFPDTQIIWNMRIGLIPVRTDDKFFAPIAHGFTKVWGDENFALLKYMTEVECVDLGHNSVHDISWVQNMPKLKYLILADTPVTDISPLAGHPSLVWLEIFSTDIEDYTPLTTCMALEDLNLGRTRGDPEPIAKMTWLKNLWWGDNLSEINLTEHNFKNRQKAEQILPAALPNTNVMLYHGAPTLRGWRDLPNYFKMRDCMGMFYMKGSTD